MEPVDTNDQQLTIDDLIAALHKAPVERYEQILACIQLGDYALWLSNKYQGRISNHELRKHLSTATEHAKHWSLFTKDQLAPFRPGILSLSSVYTAYKNWALNNNKKPMGKRQFSIIAHQHNHFKVHYHLNRYITGFKFRNDDRSRYLILKDMKAAVKVYGKKRKQPSVRESVVEVSKNPRLSNTNSAHFGHFATLNTIEA